MSYTMTLDVPQLAADYAYRQGPRLSREMSAIFVAIIQAKMLFDDAGADRENHLSELSGIARNVVIDDDHGILSRAALEKYERLSGAKANSNGKAVFDAIRACPVDVDLGKLISKRTSCGRTHPIDFVAMLKEDA